MCVCIGTHLRVCMHVRACMHVWTWACLRACMHVCTWACFCIYPYVYVYIQRDNLLYYTFKNKVCHLWWLVVYIQTRMYLCLYIQGFNVRFLYWRPLRTMSAEAYGAPHTHLCMDIHTCIHGLVSRGLWSTVNKHIHEHTYIHTYVHVHIHSERCRPRPVECLKFSWFMGARMQIRCVCVHVYIHVYVRMYM
jgi:hypothetical protein